MTPRFPFAIAALLTAGSFASLPAMAQDISFGDDSGLWASDGECDDPRFEGAGMASATDPSGEMADATDCQKAFNEGRIALIGGGNANPGGQTADNAPLEGPEGGGIDFGGDTAVWINDGECDDPRFDGPGMSAAPVDADIMGDASDCQALYMAGEVYFDGAEPVADGGGAPAPGGIDFGGDTTAWINDGECDDPRFEGPGMAAAPVEADIMGDATDCQTLFDAGQITLAGAGTNEPTGGQPPAVKPSNNDAPAGTVDFGDDTSPWINDGECDDPRFEGPGMATGLDPSNTLADATDCRALFDAGQVTMAGTGGAGTGGANTKPGPATPEPAFPVDFGADSGQWTNDGECDDPRFVGTGMAEVLEDADLFADATDCKTLFDAGMIALADGGGAAPAVDFGDDSGEWTNDGECDDPRFIGTGMAAELVDADLFADATDCKTLFDAGMITLR